MGTKAVWVVKWDKAELQRRAAEQGCWMAEVVAFLLDQDVAPPRVKPRRIRQGQGKRIQIYPQDLPRLKALAQAWGGLYLSQVISHLLREVRYGREVQEDRGVWQEIVRRAEGYRRAIAEYEASCSEGF